jgi:hypothetical protein
VAAGELTRIGARAVSHAQDPSGAHDARDERDYASRLARGERIAAPDVERLRRRAQELVLRLQDALAPAFAAGYRLAWTDGREGGWLDLDASPDAFAVIGRHPAADARLTGDPELSQRHLLATAYRLEDSGGAAPDVALRVLDLFGTLPFYLEDLAPRLSIVATGPLRFALGAYVLAAVPFRAGQLEVERSATHRTGQVSLREVHAPPSRSTGRLRYRTEISVLPRATEIAELERGLRESLDAPSRARLTFEREGRGATVEVPEAALTRGVLLGRAEKCFDRGLRAILTGHVSRSHLLLLRGDDDRVRAYDLCSTNGTRVDGARVRSLVLRDSGCTLTLGRSTGTVAVRWVRDPAPRGGVYR